MVYRFRVTYEDHEDVFRDIEIKSLQTFSELHIAIQQAIGFDNSKSAVFYTSDDFWRQEDEISIENSNQEKTKKNKDKKSSSGKTEDIPKKKKTIADLVNDPHQKFIYVFDPDVEWTFMIELLKIIPENKMAQYPQCVKSIGTAPKQYKPTNLPSPIPEEEEPVIPILEKELEIDIPEESISIEEAEEGIAFLDEEEVKKVGDEEDNVEDETEESSEGFDEEDI